MPSPILRRRVYTVETTELEQGSSYATTDLYQAAYFFSAGAKLTQTARQGRRVTFVFDAPTMLELRKGWDNGSGDVVAKAYVDALLHLKQVARQR